MAENRRIEIASLPKGALRPSDFALRSGPVPAPADGEVLCRTLALTIGAGQRAGLQGIASYAGAAKADTVMTGTGVAEVEASNDANFSPGDVVVGPTGWQEYSALRGRTLTRVETTGGAAVDPALHLGPLGYPSRTELNDPPLHQMEKPQRTRRNPTRNHQTRKRCLTRH